jgi:hypothetical protein
LNVAQQELAEVDAALAQLMQHCHRMASPPPELFHTVLSTAAWEVQHQALQSFTDFSK